MRNMWNKSENQTQTFTLSLASSSVVVKILYFYQELKSVGAQRNNFLSAVLVLLDLTHILEHVLSTSSWVKNLK